MSMFGKAMLRVLVATLGFCGAVSSSAITMTSEGPELKYSLQRLTMTDGGNTSMIWGYRVFRGYEPDRIQPNETLYVVDPTYFRDDLRKDAVNYIGRLFTAFDLINIDLNTSESEADVLGEAVALALSGVFSPQSAAEVTALVGKIDLDINWYQVGAYVAVDGAHDSYLWLSRIDSVISVPEPDSLALVVVSLAVLGLRRRKKQSTTSSGSF